MINIISDRLIIRRFVKEDWQDLYEYLSDKDVVKFEPYDTLSKEESIKEAVNRAESKFFYAVTLKNSGKVIGNLTFFEENFNTFELGFVFNSKYQGKGYASEAAKALVDYAFKNMGARRVIAMCNPKNTPSWKLMERLHMRREGHLLQNVYFKTDEQDNPIWMDTYLYGILKDEWTKLV